jgi:hypothetical protein
MIFWPALLGLVTNCSKVPTADLGEKTLQEIADKESAGRIQIVQFTKTNGIAREVAGQKIHTLEYSATAKFPRGGWKGGNAVVGYFESFAVADDPPGGWGSFGTDWHYFEPNAQLALTGEITFEDTEKGWRYKSSAVKTVTIMSNKPDGKYYDQFLGQWATREAASPEAFKVTKMGDGYQLQPAHQPDAPLNLRAQYGRLHLYERRPLFSLRRPNICRAERRSNTCGV